MRTLPLQLLTVDLENGQRGIFIGWPLVADEQPESACQVEEVWFSNIQNVPENITLVQLIRLVQRQLCCGAETLQ